MKNLLKLENYGQIKFVDEKLGSLKFIAFFMKDVYFWNSVSEITCSRMIHCTTNYYGSLNFEENTTTTKVVCFLVLYPICHIFHARKFLIFCILTMSFAKWFLTIYWNTVIFLAKIIIKCFEKKHSAYFKLLRWKKLQLVFQKRMWFHLFYEILQIIVQFSINYFRYAMMNW